MTSGACAGLWIVLAACGGSGGPDGGSPSSGPSATPASASAPAPSASAPAARSKNPLFGPVKEIAQGGENICVVLFDGQVRCVGEWPLEYETPTTSGGKNQYIYDPISVKDADGAHGLAIETTRGCGIMPDATVRCWGNTSASGNMWTGAKENELVAVMQAGIDHVTQIALTWKENCALRDDGTVICWGPRLTTMKRQPAPDPPRVLALSGVKAIDGAHMHFCALLEAGTVSCWGDARGVELTGNGTAPIRDETPHAVPKLKDAVALSVGESHNCALTRGGKVLCWGTNGAGELGLGKPSDGAEPTEIPGLDAIAVDASNGTAGTCAIRKDGSVACWGANYNCDIGDAHTGACQKVIHNSTFGQSESEFCAAPQTVAMQGAFSPKSLSFSATTVCAKAAGGELRCWGRKLFGGNGTACSGEEP